MRPLILPLALIVACGGAMADEPADTIALAKAAGDKAIAQAGAPADTEVLRHADSASLKGIAQGLDDGLRKALHSSLGAFYPCIPTHPGTSECIVAIGLGSLQSMTVSMDSTMAFGRCTGAALHAESDDLLIGDYTSAPRGKNGFVNIANRLCFWRDSGERVACPAPEPECAGK